jgi:hypothetical protein
MSAPAFRRSFTVEILPRRAAFMSGLYSSYEDGEQTRRRKKYQTCTATTEYEVTNTRKRKELCALVKIQEGMDERTLLHSHRLCVQKSSMI